MLGPDAKVVVSGYPDEPTGLAALKSGKIDMLGGATPSLQNRAHYPVAFGPTVIYDGQGFLVPTNGPIKFHLRFHDPAGTFDARAVVKLHRRGADPSCNEGDVLDYVIDELVSERSSSAVKAALKSLLEAPVAPTSKSRTRSGAAR